MGKSNRIRAFNAEKKMAATVKPTKKKGVPSWLASLIAAVVAVVVLAVCVLGVLSSNGVIMRHRYPLRSENFKISANMMSYYYQLQVQSFTSNYESNLDYFSLDTSASFKDQIYGDEAKQGYETTILGSFDGTWFDYFMSLATDQASQLLIYCEEAEKRGIELTDDDMAQIDSTLSTLTSTASLLGYSPDSYIASVYGSGVKEKDIRAAMEISLLAEKTASALQEDLINSVTHGDIQTKYEADPKLFQLIDYSYYTVTIKYTDVAKEILGKDYTEDELKNKADDVLAAYTEKINDAKSLIDSLKAATDNESFMKIAYKALAEQHYDTQYETANVAAENVPDEATRETIKTAMIDALLTALAEGKTETAVAYTVDGEKYTLYGTEVKKDFAEAMEKIENSCYTSLLTDKTTYNPEKKYFIANDEFSTWAFDNARATNDTYSILDGDGKDSATVTNDKGLFTATAYSIKAPKYRDEVLAKNVSYMLFSNEADAKAAIEALGNVTLTVDEFNRIADEKNSSGHTSIEDYTKGTLQLDAFDEWLYADSTAVGSYTATPIKADDKTYIVGYYSGDGNPAWKVTVKSEIFAERFEEYYLNMEKTYTVTVKEKLLSKIEG